MIALRAKGRSELVCERMAAAKRLSVLLADIDALDACGQDQLLEVRAEVSAVLARIAKLDEQLAECATTPLDELVEAQAEQAITPRQQRVQARGRLQATLLVLGGLPASCTAAATLLRRAVRRELKKIEASRREEFPSCD